MKYLVIFEQAGGNFSAYSPDLPGCAATGKTRQETAARMAEAIEFHLAGMREENLEIPQPGATAEYVEVA